MYFSISISFKKGGNILYSTQTVSLDKNHSEYETYLDFCVLARDLYNQALFYCRNLFTGGSKLKNNRKLHPNEIEAINFVNDNLQNCCKKDGSLFPEISKDNYVISYYHLQKLLYKTNNEDYFNNRLLPQTRNKLIDLACQNLKSFLKAIKDYSKHPDKYKGRPKLPKYKNEFQWQTIEIPKQSGKIIKEDDIYYYQIKNSKLYLGNKIHNGNLVKTSISYEYGNIILRFTFEEPDVLQKEDNNRYLGIDLGVDNFATISNNIGQRPMVIKGKVMKSKNQWFNKRKASLTSCYKICQLNKEEGYIHTNQLERLSKNRDNYFHNIFHKISKYIVSYCITNNISKVVIGNNEGWKQDINMGKRNNQIFVSIPYHKFIDILKDKLSRYGIETIIIEESYTSQSSFLDLDSVPTYKKGSNSNYNFSGKRIKTKVYQSFQHGYIHADVNGASNILRKHFSNAFDNLSLDYLQQTPIGIYGKSYC